MADLSDVEDALAAAVEAARVAAAQSWRISRGWPEAALLDRATASGIVLVTISPREGFNRNTTRYPNEEWPLPAVPPTLTVAVSGVTATFAGTCSPDQLAGVQSGTTAWSYRCVDTDTPITVATALGTASGGAVSGAALTLSGLVAARTGRDGLTLRPTRNQEVGFAVIVWASDPAKRDAAASAIDAALSDIEFLALADGSAGRIIGAGSRSSDKAENASLFRRDLYFSVDYATTISAARPVVLWPGFSLQDQQISAIGVATPSVPAIRQPTGGYAATITGDGVTASFTVSHGLGTEDVIVQVRDPSDSNARVPLADDLAPTPYTVTIPLTVPLALGAQLRVLVLPVR